MFSKRTHWQLETNELTKRCEALTRDGVSILDLTESNPTRCRFAYTQKNILETFADLRNLHYDPKPFGSMEAREIVSRYYRQKGISVDPGRIILTSSTSEAYSYLFKLLVDPAQRVLVPRPSYPLFHFLADLNDVVLDFYPLIYDEEWHVDAGAVKKSLHVQTRAILVVNPNNPTGSYLKNDELKEINGICGEKNIALICDEVFHDFRFSGDPVALVSTAGNKKVLSFTLGGVSKSLGLPQMKVGWIVVSGPDDLVKEALNRLEIIADTYLSVSTPSQNALAGWFSFQADIQKEILTRITENRRFAAELFKKDSLYGCLSSEGGWYLILKLPDLKNEEEWILEFLEKDHVFVHPGYFFDFDDGPFAVISLLPPADIFKEGLPRIARRVQSSLS